ncbi:MAG: penicillin-binding protein 2 [bacterium]|nr:penicillin-binding protein 2 [bacterium]
MAGSERRAQVATRVRFILGAFVLIALLMLVRLYFLQVVYGSEYRLEASDQYVSTTSGFYDRGDILMKNKNGVEISAATIKTGYALAIVPERIEDAAALYGKLSEIVEIDRDTFLKRAGKVGDTYEEVAHRLTADEAKRIRRLELDVVQLVPERWRTYPGETLAAHTIGFVAYEGDEQAGRYGLERYYEDVLGRTGSNLYVNFFAELFANIRDVVFVPVDKREGNIATTIEPSVQVYLEGVLADVRDKWGSKFTAGVVIDPQTGAIYAMAVSPSFNLNDFSKANPDTFANPLVERVYEMGSIVKPLTMAAGLDSGAVTPKTTYYDAGSRTLNGYTFSNYDGKARGTVPMQEILSQSLNTGAAFVAERMGKDTFRRYLYRYGVNEETGIDLPNEVRSLTENLKSPREIEYATASFGQGIALTPLATVRALAVLPDGYVEQPHIASEIRSQNGLSYDLDYEHVREQVLKKETAETITRMLVELVDTALLGGTMKLEHYSVAAKTGTAQIPSPLGGYYDDRFLHSFFGYFPAYDAKFLVFLMNVEPKDVQYASQTLTEPFMDVTQFLINHYDIPPDR